MENIVQEKTEIHFAQWMADEGLSDAGFAKDIGVSRQTVWRWRENGVVPAPRDQISIQNKAGDSLIILFGAS